MFLFYLQLNMDLNYLQIVFLFTFPDLFWKSCCIYIVNILKSLLNAKCPVFWSVESRKWLVPIWTSIVFYLSMFYYDIMIIAFYHFLFSLSLFHTHKQSRSQVFCRLLSRQHPQAKCCLSGVLRLEMDAPSLLTHRSCQNLSEKKTDSEVWIWIFGRNI